MFRPQICVVVMLRRNGTAVNLADLDWKVPHLPAASACLKVARPFISRFASLMLVQFEISNSQVGSSLHIAKMWFFLSGYRCAQ